MASPWNWSLEGKVARLGGAQNSPGSVCGGGITQLSHVIALVELPSLPLDVQRVPALLLYPQEIISLFLGNNLIS